MAAVKDHRQEVKRLKRKLALLQKKEEKSQRRLKAALIKIRTLSKSYQSKLAKNIRVMRIKIGRVKASTYVKAADDIQRHLIKGIASKDKSLRSAIVKVEKKHIAKLAKDMAKRVKKSSKSNATHQELATGMPHTRRRRRKTSFLRSQGRKPK